MELTTFKDHNQTKRDLEEELNPQDISFDSILNKIGLGIYHWKAWIMLGFLSWADGAESMVLSFVIPIFNKVFAPDFDLEATLGSGVYFGYMIGSFFCGFFIDKYGRKSPLVYASIVMVLLCFWSAFPPGVGWFVVIRSVYGIINGIYTPVPVLYLTEITPAKNRGAFISSIWINYTIGELITCIVALFTLDNLEEGNWHALLAWTTMPAIFCWISAKWFLDESPRYQMIRGEYEKSFDILNKMYRTNHATEELLLCKEDENKIIESIKKAQEKEKEKNQEEINWISAIKFLLNDGYLKITIITWINWIACCFNFNGIVYILPTALQALNEEESRNEEYNVMSVLYSVLPEFPSILLAILVVDYKWFGRKNTLIYSNFLAALCSILARTQAAPGFVFWISSAKLFFNLNFTIIYQFTSELYPTKIRGTAMGIASSVGRIGGIIMPVMCSWLSNFGPLVPFEMFGFISFMAGIATYLLPHDTTGVEMGSLDGM